MFLYNRQQVNPLLHKYSFRHISTKQLLKTLREKEKLLVTSNFSFSHNVFYSIKVLTSYIYFLLKWLVVLGFNATLTAKVISWRSVRHMCRSGINLLSDATIPALTKLKAFTDNNFTAAKMVQFPFQRLDNIVGKGENADHQHFLLFPQRFQKVSL